MHYYVTVIIIFFLRLEKFSFISNPASFFIFIFEIFFGNWNSPHTSSIKNSKYKIDTKKYLYKSEDNEDDKIEIFINNYGLRGKVDDRALSDLDILFIGGSTTIQSTITDGKTFVDVLIIILKS